ncbi:hypothetical protein REPUB_Repub16aG0095000 [Reevesia pubescens]
MGMAVRDSFGSVLLNGISSERLVGSVLHAEIKVILWGLKEAAQHGFAPLIVESDSSLAVKEIQKGDASFWEGSALILEILKWANLCTSCVFQHVKRPANSLAHNLSKLGCNHGCQ